MASEYIPTSSGNATQALDSELVASCELADFDEKNITG
jgi:hypothetical protein